MGSQIPDSASSHHRHTCSTLEMEAIKKKMQAMKVEKDNACDQADVSEEKMKAARVRAQKGEDEVEELVLKSRQLETELDVTSERLSIATLQLEEKEKQLAATELEMNALTRRVSGLEEDLEKTEVAALRERYAKVKAVADEWTAKVDTLLKEWTLLDNTVTELNTWVAKDKSSEGENQFSLEKMESTLGELKNIFKLKEKMVEGL